MIVHIKFIYYRYIFRYYSYNKTIMSMLIIEMYLYFFSIFNLKMVFKSLIVLNTDL